MFSAKFDHTQFQYETPQEKDIYVDLALKAFKMKKKDTIHYNNKDYACVAFKTEKKRDEFAQHYKNTEKQVNLYQTQEIIHSTQKADNKSKVKL